MMHLLYDVATSLAAPAVAAFLGFRPKYRPLIARFSPRLGKSRGGLPIWVHACSVGEVSVAKPLIAAMRRRWPEAPHLLTTSTINGHALAQSCGADAEIAWFPMDHPWVVRRFFDRAQPRALVLIETELWPNVLREAHRRAVPVVLVNGRISDKHFARYMRFKALLRSGLARLSAAGMQNDEYADRIVAIGAPREVVHVTGNIKFDGVATSLEADLVARLRAESGLSPGAPTLVFGSTRPGDEALAARCWSVLRDEFPSLRLVIAPRHLERLREALAPFDEPVIRRTEVLQGRRPTSERVFVLDTVGELVSFYGLASIAVIGGSFYPGVNGHNPLESAALGIPTVFGPYMRNFMDPARVLLEAQGARQAPGPEALTDMLRGLLRAPEEAARMAQRGREAVLANRGALERNLDLIASVLQHGPMA